MGEDAHISDLAIFLISLTWDFCLWSLSFLFYHSVHHPSFSFSFEDLHHLSHAMTQMGFKGKNNFVHHRRNTTLWMAQWTSRRSCLGEGSLGRNSRLALVTFLARNPVFLYSCPIPQQIMLVWAYWWYFAYYSVLIVIISTRISSPRKTLTCLYFASLPLSQACLYCTPTLDHACSILLCTHIIV